MKQQATSKILMVRPDYFGFNPQTATTNPFQHAISQIMHKNEDEIRATALEEFTVMVDTLQKYGVDVFVLPSKADLITPDAIFPNNWFSTHEDGKIVFYPLLTLNRRLERQKEALLQLLSRIKEVSPTIIDLTNDEEKGLILESTGSMVFDRVHSVAFAMASPRTIREEFEKWCTLMQFEGIYLQTPEDYKKDVYHTNIQMSIGSDFAVVCLEVLANKVEQEKVRKKMKELGKECIEISLKQTHMFCGNILEVHSRENKKLLVMSDTAEHSFTKKQLAQLKKYCTIVSVSIPTIEQVGGGGVRCMMAEIF